MSIKNNNIKKRYFVKGMHCSTCEILIKQDINNISGINKTEVSLSKGHVVIHAEKSSHIPSKNKLNDLFEELGYTFHSQKPKEQKLNANDIYKVIAIALLFVGTFYFIEKSGIFMQYSITSQSSIASYFIFGLAAGISSCAALVGGLLLSLSKNWNNLYGNNIKKTYIPFIYFNFSRIVAFGLFGGLLGYLGSFFQVSITLTAILTIVISLLMLILGLQMTGIEWFKKFSLNYLGNNKYLNKNNDLQGKYVPLIVGALTFFVPCGLTLIAQTNALNSGSFIMGMLQLGAFALGTLPILALVSFSSVKFYSNPSFSKKFSLFSGVIIVFFALYTLNSQLNVLGVKSLSDISFSRRALSEAIVAATSDDSKNGEYQVLSLEARGFDYYPQEITIKSGIRTIWEITDNGSVGCARAVYARGLYPNVIQLKPGINTVEFIAPAPGTYKISCSMGMVAPVTVRVI